MQAMNPVDEDDIQPEVDELKSHEDVQPEVDELKSHEPFVQPEPGKHLEEEDEEAPSPIGYNKIIPEQEE